MSNRKPILMKLHIQLKAEPATDRLPPPPRGSSSVPH
uniref:Uncharacterized protein n=1 Tax=Anguilla anguilla TaxID=7936 RepID=A0A0E9TFV2_ANGAN